MLKIMFLNSVSFLLLVTGCANALPSADGLEISIAGEKLVISAGSVDLVTYQQKPMTKPKGSDKFKGSNFIHPLKTPAGFCLTDLQPNDHLHHFGLWWPWKYLEAEGRKVLYWELQQGEGIIEAQGIVNTAKTPDFAAFHAESHYIDKTAPDGPKVILIEKLTAHVSPITKSPTNGYFLDLVITQTPAIKTPVEVVKYRYSGFSIRGAASWNKENSKLITSEGKERQGSNFTRAKWIVAEGDAKGGKKAGFVMMSHPDNYGAPQMLRTWGDNMFNGATFANFNPVQKESWTMEPGKKYIQNYRLFVYDGTVTEKQAEKLWSDYAKTAKSVK
ncbi:MAG: PmoA family protein [Phycisphaerae bacterium]|nr:PmoA family protein [Phycisphaerae bacterium]